MSTCRANRGCHLDLKSRPARGHVGEEPVFFLTAAHLAPENPKKVHA